MSYSGEAAEQVVRMSLQGAEAAAKITGEGAKHIAVLIYAVLKEQHKTKGHIRLTNMLKSGKELKVFAVKDEDLKRFCTEAKKYGVLYCVLKDKNATDGITDIMVRAEDAGKINRIYERFGLATVDVGSIKDEIQNEQESKATAKQEQQEKQHDENKAIVKPEQEKPDNKDAQQESKAADKQEESKPKDKKEDKIFLDEKPPFVQKMEKSRPSEHISKTKEQADKGISDRASIRDELFKIKQKRKSAVKQDVKIKNHDKGR